MLNIIVKVCPQKHWLWRICPLKYAEMPEQFVMEYPEVFALKFARNVLGPTFGGIEENGVACPGRKFGALKS